MKIVDVSLDPLLWAYGFHSWSFQTLIGEFPEFPENRKDPMSVCTAFSSCFPFSLAPCLCGVLYPWPNLYQDSEMFVGQK
jgi:hypothetical protein